MDGRRSRIGLSVLNIIGFLGTIVVNGLANALPINNKTTAALSDQYPNLFVPAGLTFSIWGVIYILLGVFVVYHAIRAFKGEAQEPFIDRIGILFFVSCLANIGWIFAWHYQILALSMVLMLLLLGCLIAIYLRLSVGTSDSPRKVKYLVHLPFSIYLGWITIATIANATALLVDLKWNAFGLGEQFWAATVIAVGIAIALTILVRRRDVFYCLVVDWALLGILIKRLGITTPPDQFVEGAAIAGLALISIGIIVQAIRRKAY